MCNLSTSAHLTLVTKEVFILNNTIVVLKCYHITETQMAAVADVQDK